MITKTAKLLSAMIVLTMLIVPLTVVMVNPSGSDATPEDDSSLAFADGKSINELLNTAAKENRYEELLRLSGDFYRNALENISDAQDVFEEIDWTEFLMMIVSWSHSDDGEVINIDSNKTIGTGETFLLGGSNTYNFATDATLTIEEGGILIVDPNFIINGLNATIILEEGAIVELNDNGYDVEIDMDVAFPIEITFKDGFTSYFSIEITKITSPFKFKIEQYVITDSVVIDEIITIRADDTKEKMIDNVVDISFEGTTAEEIMGSLKVTVTEEYNIEIIDVDLDPNDFQIKDITANYEMTYDATKEDCCTISGGSTMDLFISGVREDYGEIVFNAGFQNDLEGSFKLTLNEGETPVIKGEVESNTEYSASIDLPGEDIVEAKDGIYKSKMIIDTTKDTDVTLELSNKATVSGSFKYYSLTFNVSGKVDSSATGKIEAIPMEIKDLYDVKANYDYTKDLSLNITGGDNNLKITKKATSNLTIDDSKDNYIEYKTSKDSKISGKAAIGSEKYTVDYSRTRSESGFIKDIPTISDEGEISDIIAGYKVDKTTSMNVDLKDQNLKYDANDKLAINIDTSKDEALTFSDDTDFKTSAKIAYEEDYFDISADGTSSAKGNVVMKEVTTAAGSYFTHELKCDGSSDFNATVAYGDYKFELKGAKAEFNIDVLAKGDEVTHADVGFWVSCDKVSASSKDPEFVFDISVSDYKVGFDATFDNDDTDGLLISVAAEAKLSCDYSSDNVKASVKGFDLKMDVACENADDDIALTLDVDSDVDKIYFEMGDQKVDINNVCEKAEIKGNLSDIFTDDPMSNMTGEISFEIGNAYVAERNNGFVTVKASNLKGTSKFVPSNDLAAADDEGMPDWAQQLIKNAKIEGENLHVAINFVDGSTQKTTFAAFEITLTDNLAMDIKADEVSVTITSETDQPSSFSMKKGEMIYPVMFGNVDLISGNYEIKGDSGFDRLNIGKDATVNADNAVITALSFEKDRESMSGNILIAMSPECDIRLSESLVMEFEFPEFIDSDIFYDINNNIYGYPAYLDIQFGEALTGTMIANGKGLVLAANDDPGYVKYDVETGIVDTLNGTFMVKLDANKYKLTYGNYSGDVKAHTYIGLDNPAGDNAYGWTDGTSIFPAGYLYKMKPYDVTMTEVQSEDGQYDSATKTISVKADIATIALEQFEAAQLAGGNLAVKTKNATFIIDEDTLASINEDAQLGVVISSDVDDTYKTIVGNGILVSLSEELTFNGRVDVQVQYTLKDGQTAETLAAYYFDPSDGTLVEVPLVVTGEGKDVTATMTLEHFSDYVIKSVDNLEPQNDDGGSNNTMIFIIIGVVAVLVIAGVVIKMTRK